MKYINMVSLETALLLTSALSFFTALAFYLANEDLKERLIRQSFENRNACAEIIDAVAENYEEKMKELTLSSVASATQMATTFELQSNFLQQKLDFSDEENTFLKNQLESKDQESRAQKSKCKRAFRKNIQKFCQEKLGDQDAAVTVSVESGLGFFTCQIGQGDRLFKTAFSISDQKAVCGQ